MEIKRSPVIVAGQQQAYAKGTAVIGSKGFVFLSGSIGMDISNGEVPEGIAKQTTLALENIKTRLEEHGSSLDTILHIWWYMKGQFPDGIRSSLEWELCSRERERFWEENYPEFSSQNNPPAYTLLGVTALALPDFKVEIMVIAAIP